ncbi:hypothetical protein MTP99_019275 [Tenebrio molitor]|nr:hypothetical protein MTP99_019275 [Tenebrio molitor]
MMMKFNASGVTPVLETTKNNKPRFENILNEYIRQPSNSLGRENRSAAFFAILHAAQVLPPSSGIVLFMKKDVEDETVAPLALTEVNKKQIQVFVIWGGKNDERLLKQLALRSHGLFLRSDRSLSEVYYEEFLENIGTFGSASTILSRKNLKGEHDLVFPIDSDVTGVHISITPNITRGILTTPKGYNIDALGGEDVTRYSPGSFIKRDVGIHEIHLNTTTATTRDVGVWRFRVGNAGALYNVIVFAHTKLTANAIVTVQNVTGANKTKSKRKFLKLGLNGDVSSISNISFVSEDGNSILNDVKFTLDKDWENHLTENIENVETNGKKELNINVGNIPKESFYAVINGKDSQGHDFKRLSYIRGNVDKNVFYLPPLTVEVGLGSELITQPYRQPQLFFEVTNNGNTPTLAKFFCRDEKGILLFMNPWFKWINPQETATVRITLTTRPGFYQDLITFSVVGSETVTKNVLVDVGSTKEDRHDPYLDYHFTSDCTSVLFGACEDATWTVEVQAKDTGSGLLQVVSKPKGIYFPNGFTTGTTEEVSGFYSESCCNPDLELIAFDRQNNRKTRHLNAYRANLGPGAIAAIVLGVVLLLIIIAIIIIVAKTKCKCCKTQQSYDLPVYRGPLSSRRI